jgi:putative membrane protein
MMGVYGGPMGFGPIWILLGLFWVALIALIIWLVIKLLPGSTAARPAGAAPVAESPEQILDRMFALGEIDEQTYRTRRTALADMRRPQ